MRVDIVNYQKEVGCEIIIEGLNLEDYLSVRIPVSLPWARACGAAEVSRMTYLQKEAEVNGRSLERSIVMLLLSSGFRLEELEVEIYCKKSWGKCVWYRNHPEYLKPLPWLFKEPIFNNRSFQHAMFKTENAGDQHFRLWSTQMFMTGDFVILHESLVYRKVVFSLPPKREPIPWPVGKKFPPR